MKNLTITSLLILLVSFNINAQELSVVTSSQINVNSLPEYVIITSQNTKLLGGSGITIDAKKSKYQDQLESLQSLLQGRKKLHIRNQTDLLNAMSQLGFDFVDAFNASQASTSGGKSSEADDLFNGVLEGGTGSFRVNMIFRKKEKFRN